MLTPDILTNALKYNVDFYYDTVRGTEDYGRDSTITNIRPVSVSLCDIITNIFLELKSNFAQQDQHLIKYGIDRIARNFGMYDKNIFYTFTEKSYYGEVLGEVHFDNEKKFITTVNNFLNSEDKIEFLIDNEYGYVLDSHKNKDWKFVVTSISNLKCPQRDYFKKINQSIDYQLSPNLPIGLYKKIGNKFEVIDGYHRLCVAKNNSDCDEVEIIYCE